MDPRSILAFPFVYQLFQTLTGAHRSRIECVERYIRPKASDRVLDCGCGPGILLEYLPAVDYVGIDIDEKYIAAARTRYGDRATFRLGTDAFQGSVDVDQSGFIKTNRSMQTNLPGIFAAGQARSPRIQNPEDAASEGCKAAALLQNYLDIAKS